MTPIRVGLLTREFPPEVYGGAGVHVEYLARELSSRVELRVHAFGEPRSSPLVAGTYQPWDRLAGDRPELAALQTMSVDLAMAANLSEVQVIHSHTWYANLAGHLAKLLYAVPHVTTTHSLEPLRPWKEEQLRGGYRLSSFCERTALESADAIIAVSRGMREDVLTCYPKVQPERVHVIHNGIDPSEYRPVRARDSLDRLGIPQGCPLVIFLGRITRQKGLVRLLEAVPAIRKEAQIVLLAGAPDTPEIAAEVTELVDRLQRERGSVSWVPQILPREEVIQVLSQGTVFVCPSIYEPFGLVNLEAMAVELPVVASRVGGIPEIVVDGETGLLVDPEAGAEGLATAINDILDDPERGRRMGAAGRRRVIEKFSWSAIADLTAELYASLV